MEGTPNVVTTTAASNSMPIQYTKAVTIFAECLRIRRFEIRIHAIAANIENTTSMLPWMLACAVLVHVLPRGFVRIRSFGFLATRSRARLLPLCRRLLADYPTAHTPAAITSSPTQPTCFRCPKCSTPMLIVERFSVIPAWQLSTRSAYLDSS
jgi:hypothetical protein